MIGRSQGYYVNMRTRTEAKVDTGALSLYLDLLICFDYPEIQQQEKKLINCYIN